MDLVTAVRVVWLLHLPCGCTCEVVGCLLVQLVFDRITPFFLEVSVVSK